MTGELGALERALIDGWQRDFPLRARPYEAIARELGVREGDVLAALARMTDTGLLSRVGAAIRPNTAGASLLAAMQVPAAQVEAVADIINREPGVNHNYEREHRINLWFVVTGRDRPALAQTLQRIRGASGFNILELPLERVLHRPRFSLAANGDEPKRATPPRWCPATAWLIDEADRRLLALLGDGMTFEAAPIRRSRGTSGWARRTSSPDSRASCASASLRGSG